MLKGINQWCYPEGTPLDKVFAYSRDAGFDAVELNLNPSGGVGVTTDTTRNEAKAIADLASTYQLELRSLSTGLLWKYPLSDPNEDVRKQGRNIIEKQIQLAAAMGMDTVLVVPGTVNETTTYTECYHRSQEELRKIIPLAEACQVNLGIENVWNKFLLSPLEMANYIDELESDYVGAYCDVGNVLQFGYPEQWIQILSERIKKVHIKDFKLPVGNHAGFVPLFAGDVNWQKVSEALAAIGYKDTITAELKSYQTEPDLLAKETALQIDQILETGKEYN